MHTLSSEVEDESPATPENNFMTDFPAVPQVDQVEKEAPLKVSLSRATNIKVDNFADVG